MNTLNRTVNAFKRARLLQVSILAILVMGALVSRSMMALADRDMREALLDQARQIAQGVSIDQLKALTTEALDTNSPVYLRLKEQLGAARQANPHCRFLYFLGRKDRGDIIIHVDSEAVNSKQFTPPGRPDDEAAAACRGVFESQTEAIDGPRKNRGGSWAAALIPILEPQKASYNLATPQDAREMVRQAAQYCRAQGRERFLKEVNNRDGQFRKRDLYAFVYDLNMTMLAHPVKPELAGRNQRDEKDFDGGSYFHRKIRDVALANGSGWVDYMYENPVSKLLEPKTTYLQRVGDLIVCAGAYKGAGAVFAVMGMEIDARAWRWSILAVAIPPMLAAFALVFVLLAGMALLERRKRSDGVRAPWMKQIEAGIAAACGLVLTLWGAWMVHQRDLDNRNTAFRQLAASRTEAVAEKLLSLRTPELESLGRFMENRPDVSAAEFAQFTGFLKNNPSVLAWGWVVAVSDAEKSRFEARARDSGMPGFQIWQKDEHGNPIPASGRGMYYPIVRLSPHAENERPLGFDLGSEPIRRSALDEAHRTGLFTATKPVTLVRETGSQKAMLMFRPVYTGSAGHEFRGFAAAAVRMESLLRATAPDNSALIEISLLHDNDPPESLAASWNSDSPPGRGLSMMRTVFAFGKVISVTAHAGPEFMRLHPMRAGWLTAMAGLIATSVLSAGIGVMLGRRGELERLVAGRTEELRESERSYRDQFAYNSAIMLLVDPSSGAILDANAAAGRFYGYSREQLARMRMADICARPGTEDAGAMQSVTRDQGRQFEFQHRLADGSVRDVEVASSRIRFGERDALHSIVFDITERKRVAAAAAAMSLRNKVLLQTGSDGIHVLNEIGDVVEANDAFCQMLGYSREELMRLNVADWDARWSAEELKGRIRLLMETPAIFETQHRTRDGRLLDVEINARGIALENGHCLFASARDVTERKLMEEKIRQSIARRQREAEVVAYVACSAALVDGRLHELSAELAETASVAIQVARVGVWLFEDGDRLVNLNSYDTTRGAHFSGAVLMENEFTNEFMALKTAKYVDAHDALTDPRTAGYVEGYLKPNNIVSMLDAVVRSGGTNLGVVCFEHTGVPRIWEDDEISFACQLADQVALAVSNRERKRVEASLRESESNFRVFFESMTDMIMVAVTDGQILYTNAAVLKTLCYSASELAGMNVLQLYPPDKRREAESIYNAMLRGDRDNCPLPLSRKDGSLVPADSRAWFGVWNGADCYFVTCKNLANEEEARQRFERLFRSNPTPMALTTMPDRKIYDVNEAFLTTLGYAKDELIGKTSNELQLFPYLEQREAVAEKIIGDGRVTEFELQVRRKDGRILEGLFSGESIVSQGRQYFLSVLIDITGRKRAEAALLASNCDLEAATARANEMAARAELANVAKSEFLANMSHEIRTPMNGVLGMMGLLLDTSLSADQRRYAETARVSGEALMALLNDILDFSKIEAGKLELETLDFNLHSTMDDLIGSMALRAQEKGLLLGCVVAPEVPALLQGDPGRLRQILVNLTVNAIKFTKKGEVVVRVNLTAQTRNEVHLRFSVRDTGIGIPPDKISRLFAKFSQIDTSTTRTHGGTGLGLAISKQLAGLMGGEIGVNSEPGKGSEFWFTARLARQSAGDSSAGVGEKSSDLSGVRVLIVDDHPVNREVLRVLLQSWGMRPEEASDGPWAIQMMEEAADALDPFRIAILDMQMPGMDGRALGRLIREHPCLSATRLVMCASLGHLRRDQLLEEIGFIAIMSKPVRRQDLREALELSLGAAKPDSMREIAASPFVLSEGARNARILVADDNITNQQVAAGILKKLGLKTEVAANGAEAVKILESIDCDLVLMDGQMPDMDGFQAARVIRDENSRVINHHVPIIAMTALAMRGDREKCFEAGMDDYLTKPVEVAALIDVLEKWLNPKEENNPVPAPAPPRQNSPMPVRKKDSTVFDRSILMQRVMNDEDLARAVVEAFLADLPGQINQLKSFARLGDAIGVERQAHKIKGACGSVGGESLRRLAEELEKAGETGDMDAITRRLSELDAQYGALEESIRQELCPPNAMP